MSDCEGAPAGRSEHSDRTFCDGVQALPRMSNMKHFFPLLLLAAGLSSCGLLGSVVRTALPFAGVKMALSCLPEITLIDTPSGPRPVKHLTAGDVVTGYGGRPVRILQKHTYLENPATVFLQLTFSGGAKVDVCRMHRVGGVRARDIRIGQTIAGKLVEGIKSHTGEIRSCDLLTEDAGYQVGGVPVNSMIEEMHAAAASGLRGVRD